MAEDEQQLAFEIQLPPELELGAYANFLTVWHTPFEFTLDFSVLQQPQLADPDNSAAGGTVPARVVARVKLPPTLVFEVMRALNDNMTRFEASYGAIQRPEPPRAQEPPDEHD